MRGIFRLFTVSQGTVLFLLAFGFSRLTLPLRDILVAALYGTNSVTDNYFLTLVIAGVVANTIGGTLNLVRLPKLVTALKPASAERGTALAGEFKIFLFASLAAALISALLGSFQLRTVSAQSLAMVALVSSLQVMVIFFETLFAANKSFYRVTILPIIANLVSATLLLVKVPPVESILIGTSATLTVAGFLSSALMSFNLKALFKVNFARSSLVPDGFGLTFGSNVIAGVTQLIEQHYLKLLSVGDLSAYGYAQRFHAFPLNTLSSAVSTLKFTQLAESSRHGVYKTFDNLLVQLFVVGSIIALTLFLARDFLVSLLLLRGQFQPGDATKVSQTLGVLLVYFPFALSSSLLVRMFQIIGGRKILFLFGLVNIVQMIAYNHFFKSAGILGVAFATTTTQALTSIGLVISYLFLRKKSLSQ